MTRQTCVLSFVTSLGGKKNVRVNDPRPVLTVSGLNAAANSLISANAFDATIGNLVSFEGAEVITKTTTAII
jgi:hypothetical protein